MFICLSVRFFSLFVFFCRGKFIQFFLVIYSLLVFLLPSIYYQYSTHHLGKIQGNIEIIILTFLWEFLGGGNEDRTFDTFDSQCNDFWANFSIFGNVKGSILTEKDENFDEKPFLRLFLRFIGTF